jgi:hypothetical protein
MPLAIDVPSDHNFSVGTQPMHLARAFYQALVEWLEWEYLALLRGLSDPANERSKLAILRKLLIKTLKSEDRMTKGGACSKKKKFWCTGVRVIRSAQVHLIILTLISAGLHQTSRSRASASHTI